MAKLSRPQKLRCAPQIPIFCGMTLFSKKFTIIVACRANITRSAYLHAYMEHYIRTHMPYARKKLRILSAGVEARSGASASQVVKHVARMHGFHLRHHSSDPFTRRLVKQADVILVMEQWQKDALLDRFKQAEGKTYLLMEYLWHDDPAEIRDIPDPTGQDTADYEEFIDVAHAEVDRIFRELGREGII